MSMVDSGEDICESLYLLLKVSYYAQYPGLFGEALILNIRLAALTRLAPGCRPCAADTGGVERKQRVTMSGSNEKVLMACCLPSRGPCQSGRLP